jgi:hypothetical protein
VANLFDLSSISIMGSAGFLLIFGAVNAANVRLHKRTKAKKWISITGIVACVIALLTLIWYVLTNSPADIYVLIVMVFLAFAIEYAYRKYTGRKIKKIHFF